VSNEIGDPGLYDTPATPAAQRAAFTGGQLPVAVYGLGKMGLPLAAVYADVTGNTTGVDIDGEVVRTVNAGDCHIKREPGLSDLVSELVEERALRAESDPETAAREAAVHVLMVPTLLTDDREPDLSAMAAAAGDVGAGLDPGDVVFVESTVPPRTTADRIVPLLAEQSGLVPGEFGVAAFPERTVSGQALADIRGTHPKVVGGIDAESTRVAALVYDEITDNEVIEAADAATAEAVKVFEGVYRDVNIALANQLAQYAPSIDIDVNEAIDVANTQPFCDIHTPGPGVGGHCIPVYPYFLVGEFDLEAPLLTAAREMNDLMPAYTVSMLREVLAAHGVGIGETRVLLVGMTYKADVEELRNAPALEVARLLGEQGATVLAVDPVLEDWSGIDDVERLSLSAVEDVAVDAAAVLAFHDEFDDVDWGDLDAPILDGRRTIDPGAVDAPVYSIGGRWP